MQLNEEAFVLFNSYIDRLLSEAEHPTPTINMPRTVEELLKMRERATAARKAKRNGGTHARAVG
jgi:hypothetical protein